MALGVIVLVGGVLAWRFGKSMFASEREDLIYHTVKEEPLEITVVERGALEAARNEDLWCKVKSRGMGAQAATSIRWIIEDGTHVKKGDKVVELDKSYLEDQKLSQEIADEKARAVAIKGKGDLDTAKSQNESDLLDAKSKLELAELDLEKYVADKLDKDGKKIGGEYVRDLNKALGDLKEAESNVEMWRERSAWTRRMFEKKFKTSTEVEADEAKLKSAELVVSKLKNEMTVLTEFMKKRTVTDLESKVKLAKQALDRVVIQSKAKEGTALTDLKTAEKALKQEEEKLKDIEEQIANCTMTAPKDGMVVYYADERSRGGFGSAQSVIMQGEPVREGQKLIRIPDLDRILVNTRVHEAMVSRIRPLMKVDVRVDAVRDRVLKSSVKSVATIAIANDWRSAGDVKMYQTIISIDEPYPGLKPGMSAEVSIHVDATDKPVPAVPVQAVVGGPEMGTKRTVYVKGANGQPEERDVEIGLSNDKIAEIRSGLKAGEQVVLNPKVLVGDKVKTRSPGELSTKEGGVPVNGTSAPGTVLPAGGAPKPAGVPGTPGANPGGPAASPGAGVPAAAGPGAGGVGPGAGGAGGARRPQGDFVNNVMALDANKDGKVSKDEVTDERMLGMFDSVDANKDGALTREELQAAAARFGSGRGARGGQGGAGGPPMQ